jgi:L-iditol 2-dehydrogenase
VNVTSESVADLRADVVIDTAGGSDAVDRAVEVASRGAVIGLVGEAFGRTAFDFQRAMETELTIAPCWSFDTWEGRSEFAAAIALVAGGAVRLAPAISHRFPLEELAEAFAAADDRGASKAVKVLIEP